MGDDPVSQLNEIKHRQLDEFFDQREESDKKPWQTKEWKERRTDVIGDECKWCGDAEEPLQLHHYDEPDFNAEREWIRTEDELFVTSDSFDIEEHVKEPSKCPRCTSTNVYDRKTKEPTYRCRRCEYEFPDADGVRVPDLVAADWPGVYATREFFESKLDWVRENVDDVRREFSEAYDEHWREYLSLTETVTICRRCHFMHHEHGQKVCDICGDDYGKSRDGFDEEYVCWMCVVRERGLAKCLECGDNWYDPSKTGACKECRQG